MEIKKIEDKKIWEEFLEKCKEKTFLQSFNWGEFNEKMGNKIWRFGIFENEKFLALALTIKISARRGNFLFVPHGPVLNSDFENKNLKFEIFKFLFDELKTVAKKEKCDFIRIAPILERNENNEKIFKKLGFREAPIHIHPEITWELDISKSEDEILREMRKTTRYLIRQAQKNKEIEIVKSKNLKDLEVFNQIYSETARRHKFSPFSFDYLSNEILAFAGDDQILIFLGKYNAEAVAGGIFIFWQGIGFYHHGASSLKYPKIPVSYYLIWEAIKEAKKRGCQKFNFWGIAPPERKNHPWSGLSLFKMGFGGKKKEYLKTKDFPLTFKYWLCFFVELMRKIKRRL